MTKRRDSHKTTRPQEIGRDDRAISFVKGCYLGQETVARIDALGHVNQILKGLRLELRSAAAESVLCVLRRRAQLLHHACADVRRELSRWSSLRIAVQLRILRVRRRCVPREDSFVDAAVVGDRVGAEPVHRRARA